MKSAIRRTRACLLSGMLCVLACASGPTYRQLGDTLPAIPPGQGRIVLYMTGATEVPSFRPEITIDGVWIGELRTGSFFYLDRPAGLHVVGVRARESDAAFGNQGATEPVPVDLEAGGTAYVQSDALSLPGMVKVVLTLEDPADGQRDLSDLVEIAPEPPTR